LSTVVRYEIGATIFYDFVNLNVVNFKLELSHYRYDILHCQNSPHTKKEMLSSAPGKLVLYFVTNVSYITAVIAYTIIQGDNKVLNRMESVPSVDVNPDVTVSFSHFHMYVDKVDDLANYKSLERRLNTFDESLAMKDGSLSVEEKKQLWRSLELNDGINRNDDDGAQFTPQNCDVIRQLITGLGFRITGYADHASTRTVLVSSRDPNGVQIMISAMKQTTGSIGYSKTSSVTNNKDMCEYGEFSLYFDPHMHHVV
jgi:hypothetical protein